MLPKHIYTYVTYLLKNQNADINFYNTRNRDCVHTTTCRLTIRKHSIRFGLLIMELYILEIH